MARVLSGGMEKPTTALGGAESKERDLTDKATLGTGGNGRDKYIFDHEIPLDAFPARIREKLKEFDLDNSGTISLREGQWIAAEAVATRESQKRQSQLALATIALSLVIIALSFTTLGMSVWANELTSTVEADSSGNMFYYGSTTPLSISAAELVDDDTYRNSETYSALSIDTVESYSTLLDLVTMPREVLDGMCK